MSSYQVTETRKTGQKQKIEFTRSIMSCAVLILITTIGCAKVQMTAEAGVPLDEKAIKEIVIGRTTRSEVFKLLGTPHSIFQGQAELKESYNVPAIGDFFSYSQNRYLSSIDEKHYALLYRFMRTSSKAAAWYVVVIIKDTQIRMRNDEFLLLVNKETQIVEDVAYRKETSKP